MQEEANNINKLQNLLSIGEASDYVGVSIDTLRRWEKKGKIESYRSPGNHRYFKKSDLDKLFGRKYERDEETKPRSIQPPDTQSIDKQPKESDSNIFEEEVITLTTITPDDSKLLTRPSRDIRIPIQSPVRIIEEETHVDYVIQDIQAPKQEVPTPQAEQSILTPPSTTIDNNIDTSSVNKKEVVKKERKISKLGLFFIIISTVVSLLAAIVIVMMQFSKPQLLSPIP